MTVYKTIVPLDKNRTALQNVARAKSLVTYSKDNASVSSVISVSHDTTLLEVAAVGGPAVMRWVATTDTQASVVSTQAGANFDHVVGTGTVRQFAIPEESIGINAHSVVGINRKAGLYQRVAIKSIGVASVLLTEY